METSPQLLREYHLHQELGMQMAISIIKIKVE